MKSACIIATTIALVTLGHAQRPQRPASLFNGSDLSGWEGDPARWSVVDGVITGSSSQGPERRPGGAAFLIYRAGQVDDFELRMKIRVSGAGRPGILYRGHLFEQPGSGVAGYQLQIPAKQGQIGMLHGAGKRGTLALPGTSVRLSANGQRKVIGKVDGSEAVDRTQWNEYSITARGSRLIHMINGKVVCSAIDDDAGRRPLSGVIALQLPTDGPARIEVKGIILQRYNRVRATSPDAPNPDGVPAPPVPEWIWTADDLRPGEAAYLRRPWNQQEAVESATLTIAADGPFTAFLNGEEVARGSSKGQVIRSDLTREIRVNYNHLAVRADNTDRGAGVVARLQIEHADGSTSDLVTDQRWLAQATAREPQGWKTNPASRRDWRACRVIGKLGIEPWGDLFATQEPPPSATPTALTAPPGFKIDKIYEVPIESQGSWTALAAAGEARLFACDQAGSLYQIRLGAGSDGRSEPVTVEPVGLAVGQANGLLWAFDSLFVCSNGEHSGLYRLTDEAGDGILDTSTLLERFDGKGELGPHGIAAGPSPLSIYVVSGNQTALPTRLGRFRPPPIWDADQLLPSPIPDAPRLPGAWISMVRANGLEEELHSVGLRNPYDIAFNQHGDLFTSDADSPSDRGTPFFRPAGIYHVPMGADFGARGLGKNFPSTYPDTLPPVIELEPGSPTGLTFGRGAAFPDRFQEALFVCDWSRSCIDVIHLTAVGASYQGEREEFISGPDLLVTDITIADHGAMFFTTGGRAQRSALWRVTYTGDEDTTPVLNQPLPPDIARIRSLRERLGNLLNVKSPQAVPTAWPHLRNPDRFIRYAARTAIEHHAPELWLERFREETDADAILELSVALARTGTPDHQAVALEKLTNLEFARLTAPQKIAYLRALGLAFIRLSPPSDEQRVELAAQLSPHFPCHQEALDLELSRMLIYLRTPGSIDRTLDLLTHCKSEQVASAYATFLSAAKDGWTPVAKANYLAWIDNRSNRATRPQYQDFLRQLKSFFSGEETSRTNE